MTVHLTCRCRVQSRPNQLPASPKWIDDQHALDRPPVAHILGLEFLAAEGAGGSDDGAVPIGKAVGRLDFERAEYQRQRDLLNGESSPGGDQAGRYVVGQRVGARRAVGWT